MSNEPDKISPDKLEKLLPQALAAIGKADEQHFELDELNRLADARREKGQSWDMPVHLSRCSLCLDAFLVLLEGAPTPSGGALRRFVEIGQSRESSPLHTVSFPARWKLVLKVAASVAILLGAVWVFNHLAAKTPAYVREGAVALQDGQVLARGSAIPGRVIVTTTEPTRADLHDGSQVELTKDTKVSFHESFRGSTTVALNQGQVVASVAKQEGGRQFVVKTPLAEVTVVGTRFSVTCSPEEVIVYQSTAGQIETQGRRDIVRAVRVTVFEGVVRVRRLKEQADVRADQVAVLRENEPGIDLSGEKR